MAFTRRRFTLRLAFFAVFLVLLGFFVFNKYMDSKLPETERLQVGYLNAEDRKTQVDLVVVEEHHEVLEYWFDAANKGIIPKTGNVLLHIDGHSDMAPPELIDNYPFFRWPKNRVELQAMMQSNDVFIQGAAMSGLFKKVIWVWPSWDEDSHDNEDQIRYFGGGWTEIMNEGKKQKIFCECEYKEDGVTKEHCMYFNRSVADRDYEGTRIATEKCTVLGKIILQELVDYNALNKLTSGKLIAEGESVLLDIDEDFFGCVLRGQSLLDAGVPWVNVEEIDELLSEIVCPKDVQHEDLGDNLMQQILALIVKKCKKTKQITNDCVNPGHPSYKDFATSVNKIFKQTEKGIYCEMDEEDSQKKISLLIESLIRLEVRQLRAFAKLGFCMETSLRSFEAPGFELCHGANEPNSSVVSVHMPGENELNLRLSRLRRIVQAKSYPTPGLVTLCRSVRDGYTPVRHFKEIEQTVIESVMKSRPGVRFNVVYDDGLLGGKEGWPSRQRKVNSIYQIIKKRTR